MLLLVALFIVIGLLRVAANAKLTDIVNEGQRGVIYRSGKFEGIAKPGAHWITFGRTLTRVQINEQTMQIGGQEILTADRLPVRVSAQAIYKVIDPRLALEASAGGYSQSCYLAIQLALRDVASELPLEDFIDQRTKLDPALTERAKGTFAAQGCELISLSLRDVVLPGDVKRLATEVARAKMEAAASLERARGEQATLRSLANAARVLKGNPELMNLRLLQAVAAAPGKTPPTIILGGGSGIVPVPAIPVTDVGTATASDD